MSLSLAWLPAAHLTNCVQLVVVFEKALTNFAIKYAEKLSLANRGDVELGEKWLGRSLTSDSQEKLNYHLAEKMKVG